MNYGVKVTQQEADALNETKEHPSAMSLHEKAHILLTLTIPYLNGAYDQIARYEAAATRLTPQTAPNVVNICLHETSSLFEDVCTVSKYITELCGYSNNKHQLWVDVRNHIRHDVRENFDTTNKRDAARRESRLKRLGVSDKLQTSIGFDRDRVSIGTTIITMEEVREYLMWASQIVGEIIRKAKEDGKIKET